MSTREIKVHMDELEYTAQGLRTPADSPIALTVGSHNIIQVTRPERVELLEPGINGFAFNSSFPTPGVLQLFLVPELRALLEEALIDGAQFVRVFGHTDATGNEAANKIVSERRAQVVLALLTADVEGFATVAEDEGWGLGEAQVMLRALRCDPGPADATMGPLTTRALQVFANQFNAGMFHRHLTAAAPAKISVTAQLDSQTLDALLDAFVSVVSLHIDALRLHPTHPWAGCSEFNQFSDDARQNRRVSLALYPALPPHYDKAPCRAGDHTACPADSVKPSSCFWYRQHFIERTEASVAQRHFDLQWLFLNDGRVMLSALTTVPDGSAVEFRVYRSPEVSDVEQLSIDDLGDPLCDAIKGEVRGGVAFCVWSVGSEEAELLRHENWGTPIPFAEALGADLLAHTPRARVPVFTITGCGAQAVSLPPLRDVGRLVWGEEHASEPQRYVLMTDMLGRVYHALFGPRAAQTDLRALSTSVHAALLPLK
ncbi:MAG: hypothetical protein ACE37F_21030 [Nannocystaceae bacterium]|nr:hypothetical protein [bacterium]